MIFFAADTSNYKTSLALYDTEGEETAYCGRVLPVREGECGLRQNDTLFHHTVNAPPLAEELLSGKSIQLTAAAASGRPREERGSYMPCFLAGVAQARTVASAFSIPYYEFTHQQGHLAAVLHGAGRHDLFRRDFLAWHLSGGTTELLYVRPDRNKVISAVRVGGTTDLSAGQVIDRAGVMLGLKFPCGAELEELSERKTREDFAHISVKDTQISLSGLQNKVEYLFGTGMSSENIAYYTIASVLYSVEAATDRAMAINPGLPLICGGGVMANRKIRKRLEEKFGALFAPPELSGDNALGIAILAAKKYEVDRG